MSPVIDVPGVAAVVAGRECMIATVVRHTELKPQTPKTAPAA